MKSTAAEQNTGPVVWQARRRAGERPRGAKIQDVESGQIQDAVIVVDATPVAGPMVRAEAIDPRSHPMLAPSAPSSGILRPSTFCYESWFSFCCCCWPLGLVALFFSWQTQKKLAAQDFEAASKMSKMALRFSLIALFVGIFITIFGWVIVTRFSGDVKTVLQIIMLLSTAFITLILRLLPYLSFI